MKTLQKALLAALLTGLAVVSTPTAVAQEGDGRWFVTLQYGEVDYDVTLESNANWWGNVDDTTNTYAVGVGYDFVSPFGVRLMYERAHRVHIANQCPPGLICPAVAFTESSDTDTLSLVAIPRWKFAPGWELYGTAGLIGWRISPDGAIGRDSGIDAIAGVGVGYEFPIGLALALEYQETVFGPHLDYDALRLSISFGFGS